MKIRYISADNWAFGIIPSYEIAEAFFNAGIELFEISSLDDGEHSECLIVSLSGVKHCFDNGRLVGVEIGDIFNPENMI